MGETFLRFIAKSLEKVGQDNHRTKGSAAGERAACYRPLGIASQTFDVGRSEGLRRDRKDFLLGVWFGWC